MPAPERLPKRHVIVHESMKLIARFDEIAQRRGVPRNTVIAEAMRQYIARADSAAKAKTPNT